ncbi:MAG TPA: hypothetical protein VGG46_09210, partial [Terriglobales bacterium]
MATPPVAGTVPSAAPIPQTVPAPASSSGGGALKAILIVVGVIIVVGVLAASSIGFFFWRMAHHSRIRNDSGNVSIETPFGSVQTTKDPQEAARNLGIDAYPGAEVLKEGSSSATFGGVRTASLSFETTDSVDKVCSFYKPKFPNAMIVTSQADQCSIVSNDHGNMITVSARTEGGKTKI